MSSAANNSRPLNSSRRRSRRVHNQSNHPSLNVPSYGSFRKPWNQHYVDIGHCRFQKCARRVLQSSASDLQHLKVSLLAMSIRASSAYTPKHKQERALIAYTDALLKRKMEPNDYTTNDSAVQWAAYYGYTDLLRVLLEAGCSISGSNPERHALHSAVMNGQSASLSLLFELRKKECQTVLEQEVSATVPLQEVTGKRDRKRGEPTTMDKAFINGDLVSIEVLRDEGKAMFLGLSIHKCVQEPEILLRELYPSKSEEYISSWSSKMHWSFPLRDRRMINWIWYRIANCRTSILNDTEQSSSNGELLPPEVWLRVLSFVGRKWWTK